MNTTQLLNALLLCATCATLNGGMKLPEMAKNASSLSGTLSKLPLGVVNVQNILPIMGESPEATISQEIKDIDADMQKELDGRGSTIETKQENLKKKTEELKKSGKNDEAAVTAIMNLESEIKIDYQKYQARAKELAAQMQEKVQEVYKKIGEISETVAKEMGLSLILPGPVLYVEAKYDITKEVADRLNNKYRAEKRAKMIAKQTNGKSAPVGGTVNGTAMNGSVSAPVAAA